MSGYRTIGPLVFKPHQISFSLFFISQHRFQVLSCYIFEILHFFQNFQRAITKEKSLFLLENSPDNLLCSGYIHGYRNSSDTKRLFSRQSFPMPKTLYKRLPCIQYKSIKALSTRQPFLIPKCLYTRLPCIKHKSAIYMAAVSYAKRFI